MIFNIFQLIRYSFLLTLLYLFWMGFFHYKKTSSSPFHGLFHPLFLLPTLALPTIPTHYTAMKFPLPPLPNSPKISQVFYHSLLISILYPFHSIPLLFHYTTLLSHFLLNPFLPLHTIYLFLLSTLV